MIQDLHTMMKKRVAMKGRLSRHMNKAKDVISKESREQSDIDVPKDVNPRRAGGGASYRVRHQF